MAKPDIQLESGEPVKLEEPNWEISLVAILSGRESARVRFHCYETSETQEEAIDTSDGRAKTAFYMDSPGVYSFSADAMKPDGGVVATSAKIRVKILGEKKPDKESSTQKRIKKLRERTELANAEKALRDARKVDEKPKPKINELYALRFGARGVRKLHVFANDEEKKIIAGFEGVVNFADGTSKKFKIDPIGHAVVDPPIFTNAIGYEVIAGTKHFRGILVP